MVEILDDGFLATLEDRYFPKHPMMSAGCGDTESATETDSVQYSLRDMAGYFLISVGAVALARVCSSAGSRSPRRRRRTADPARHDSSRRCRKLQGRIRSTSHSAARRRWS